MKIMAKFISLLLLFSMHACLAQHTPRMQISLAGGYGQENLQWSTAGEVNGQNPNVLSALRWKSVGGPVARTYIRFTFFKRWQLEGEYERIFYLSGNVDDTDYGGNDRTNIVYAARFNAGKGGSNCWQAGLANQIALTHEFSITPSAGFGQFHQSLYLLANTTAFNDLNSTYKTKWTGPYGQILCSIGLTKKLGLNASLRYSQVQYRASANWNLISTFSHPESFRHTAKGYSMNAKASLLYHVSDMHSIGIKGCYSRWQTGRGLDELYLATGEMQQTQLNEVRSVGWQVMVEWQICL
jgi:hypothetical protein